WIRVFVPSLPSTGIVRGLKVSVEPIASKSWITSSLTKPPILKPQEPTLNVAEGFGEGDGLGVGCGVGVGVGSGVCAPATPCRSETRAHASAHRPVDHFDRVPADAWLFVLIVPYRAKKAGTTSTKRIFRIVTPGKIIA